MATIAALLVSCLSVPSATNLEALTDGCERWTGSEFKPLADEAQKHAGFLKDLKTSGAWVSKDGKYTTQAKLADFHRKDGKWILTLEKSDRTIVHIPVEKLKFSVASRVTTGILKAEKFVQSAILKKEALEIRKHQELQKAKRVLQYKAFKRTPEYKEMKERHDTAKEGMMESVLTGGHKNATDKLVHMRCVLLMLAVWMAAPGKDPEAIAELQKLLVRPAGKKFPEFCKEYGDILYELPEEGRMITIRDLWSETIKAITESIGVQEKHGRRAVVQNPKAGVATENGKEPN